ncbi:MAG: hypothetical protein JRN67_02670, partial [Nitrososphaerota archaeon]|nr:hypothetical protein [Nitrososphaerota archaeon]
MTITAFSRLVINPETQGSCYYIESSTYSQDDLPLTDQPEIIRKEPDQNTVDGARMSIFDHLAELAGRLKKCLYAFIIAFAVISSLPNPF